MEKFSKLKKYLLVTKKFHNRLYEKKGLNYQRAYPNEDVVRFVKSFPKKNQKNFF